MANEERRTRQGVRDLNDPRKANGKLRSQAPVCFHQWVWEECEWIDLNHSRDVYRCVICKERRQP